MKPRVTIITPSYNKHEYVRDAIRSVVHQHFKDWEYWILENSIDEVTNDVVYNFVQGLSDERIKLHHYSFPALFRKEVYVPAHLLNYWLPKIKTDYFLYLSDDDYLTLDCLEKLVAYMDHNPDKDICYYSLKVVEEKKDGSFGDNSEIKADRIIEKGQSVDCVLDGGQVFARTKVLKDIEKPYFHEGIDEDTSHCDGMFLSKLSKLYSFYPVPEFLSVKRRTKLSTFINV